MTENKKIKEKLTITEIETNLTEYGNLNKIYFTTDTGMKISLKPKIKNETYQGGIKVVSKVMPKEISQLPDIVKRMGKIISSTSKVSVNAVFLIFENVDEGNNMTKQYYYTTPGLIKKWSLCDDPIMSEENIGSN